MVSVRTLAKIAGVSPMTVSRALRDDPRVHPETARRIHELAQRYHCLPRYITPSYRSAGRYVIGCLVPTIAYSLWPFLNRGIVAAAGNFAMSTITVETNSAPPLSRMALYILIEQKVDGIFLINTPEPVFTRDEVLAVRSQGIRPVGILGTISDCPIDRVESDEERLATLAVEYLMSLGHQRIAYAGDRTISRSHHMAACFQRFRLDPALLQDLPHARDGQFDAEYLIDTLLHLPHPPTAIIAVEDHIAATIMQHLYARGMRVPDDVSILGVGNSLVGLYTWPPLTTIDHCCEEIGRCAVELLHRRIREYEDGNDKEPETLLVTPSLQERGSCGPPR